MFVNFKNVTSSLRVKPPFGIAQIGKSFRNEITPGNFLFRSREFEQMEMEYFVPPGEAARVASSTGSSSGSLVLGLGIASDRTCGPRARRRRALALLERDERHRVPVPDRLAGARGDRQPRRLRPEAHTRESGTKLECDRPRGAIRAVRDRARPRRRPRRARVPVDAYDEEESASDTRTVLRAPSPPGPGQGGRLAADRQGRGMVERRARSTRELRRSIRPSTTIGRDRQALPRQDEIGTPWALTIDEQTLEDDTVTIRDRDSLKQEREPDRRGARRCSRSASTRPGSRAASASERLHELGRCTGPGASSATARQPLGDPQSARCTSAATTAPKARSRRST